MFFYSVSKLIYQLTDINGFGGITSTDRRTSVQPVLFYIINSCAAVKKGTVTNNQIITLVRGYAIIYKIPGLKRNDIIDDCRIFTGQLKFPNGYGRSRKH